MSESTGVREVDWTDEQKSAIDADAANLVVTAAAGAGKTRVLVERYLRCVRAGIQPDEILTITFTNKAAAEMKSRIVRALMSMGLPDMAQVAETGPIQTIHSFCERMLRENALEAGLDPLFEVQSDSQFRYLLSLCIREALAADFEAEPQAASLVRFLAGERDRSSQSFRATGGPYSRLEELLGTVVGEIRSSGIAPDQFAEWYADPEALRRHVCASVLSAQPERVQVCFEALFGQGKTLRGRDPGAGELGADGPVAGDPVGSRSGSGHSVPRSSGGGDPGASGPVAGDSVGAGSGSGHSGAGSSGGGDSGADGPGAGDSVGVDSGSGYSWVGSSGAGDSVGADSGSGRSGAGGSGGGDPRAGGSGARGSVGAHSGSGHSVPRSSSGGDPGAGGPGAGDSVGAHSGSDHSRAGHAGADFSRSGDSRAPESGARNSWAVDSRGLRSTARESGTGHFGAGDTGAGGSGAGDSGAGGSVAGVAYAGDSGNRDAGGAGDVLGGSLDEFRERLKAAYRAADLRAPSWIGGASEEAADEQALEHACGLVQLALSTCWRLEREMNRTQALDFTALEARAVRLIERSEATRARLAHQYRVVMVDEAQDVNPIQYRLLDGLAIADKMMVGDAQQSIFGFRHAEVELFSSRVEQAASRRLSRNFRSVPGILRFVDYVFGVEWGNAYRPMCQPTPASGSRAIDFEDTSAASFEGVEFWRKSGKSDDAIGVFLRELLTEGTKPGDIAILVRQSWYAAQLKELLARHGIESRIVGGNERFYTRIEVRDLANALRAVAEPQDDFALLACLRSPLVGLSLDSIVLLAKQPGVASRLASFEPPVAEDAPKLRSFLAWYADLSSYADRLSAWEVLSELFARSDYLPSLARRADAQQLLANVRKLLALAIQEPELGPLEYAERIREIQDLSHREGDAPATSEEDQVVSIMTVHKSKGLEFDTVVVPQTDLRLTGKTRELLIESRLGLVATKFDKSQSLMHRLLEARRQTRNRDEEWRLNYVAFTRAKNRLCICLNEKPTSGTLGGTLTKLIPPTSPGLRIRSLPEDA